MCRRLFILVVGVIPLLTLGGCSSPASQSSPESVRDPLGIDRAINDYYFPNGVPQDAGSSDLNAPPDAGADTRESSAIEN